MNEQSIIIIKVSSIFDRRCLPDDSFVRRLFRVFEKTSLVLNGTPHIYQPRVQSSDTISRMKVSVTEN